MGGAIKCWWKGPNWSSSFFFGNLFAAFSLLGLCVVKNGRFKNLFKAGLILFLGFGEKVIACPGRRVGPEGSGGSLVGPDGRGCSS